MDLGSEVLFITAPVVSLLVFACLFLLDDAELTVLLSFDQVALSHGTSLLVLLHDCLPLGHESLVLHSGEIAQFAKTVLLAVRLEELAIKLISKIEFCVHRAKAGGRKVEAKGLNIEVCAANLLNHL